MSSKRNDNPLLAQVFQKCDWLCDNFVKMLWFLAWFLSQAFLAFMVGIYLGQFVFYGFQIVLLSVCRADAFSRGVCWMMTAVIYFASVVVLGFFFIRACRRAYA